MAGRARPSDARDELASPFNFAAFRVAWSEGCAEFQSIGLANRVELIYLDDLGVTVHGVGESLVRMPAHGPFPGLDAVS